MLGSLHGQRTSTTLPRLVQGLRVDDAFLMSMSKKPSSMPWCVHSVFRHAINIASSDGTLLTITTKDSMPAPYALVCSATRLDHLGIEPGAEVWRSSSEIGIGRTAVISMCRAAITSSLITSRHVDREVLTIGYAALGQGLETVGRRGSFLLGDEEPPASRELHRRLQKGRRVARRAGHRWEPDESQQLCDLMLGLGVGLTPSGDDYLVGFLIANLAGASSAGWVAELACVAAATARSATNAISAAAVLGASLGRARPELIDVVHAALDGNTVRLHSSLGDLLGLGSTSGSDMAVGVFDALHAMLTT
jgi:hypothetical protein